jgi:D-3-phosphoglycerate dehydrogenase
MKKVLANDGIAPEGKKLLEENGFEVDTNKIAQEELGSAIHNYDVLVVRSATKVTPEVVANPGNLKLVVRAGVGIDNIDVKAAEAKGIQVNNTPNSSSLSVAELAIAHLAGVVRFLHESNRKMPVTGETDFKELKKQYEKGTELRGKTLGIIGFGRIGQETAKLAIGLGMKVIAFNRTPGKYTLKFDHLPFKPAPELTVETVSLEEVLKNSDFISLHVPGGQAPLIGEKELVMMKAGVGIINCARGGVVDELALIAAAQNGKVAYAGIDVFDNEPKPRPEILKEPKFSLTPHIGASTREAQDRVSQEVAELIIAKMK